MLVTTATVGNRWRNDPSDSSASATRISPLAQARVGAERARLAADDRRRIQARPRPGSTAIIVVVVVLPWLPATATPSLTRISSPSISARGMTGMSRARAAGDLRVVGAHRAGHDDHVGARDVLGAVADADAGAQRRQPARDVALAHVRAGDRVAEVQQHLGDARHADAADADEMDRDVALAEHRPMFNAFFRGRAMRLRLARATLRAIASARRRCRGWRRAAPARPSPRPCCAWRAGSARISSTRSARRVADASRLRAARTAAPARANASAFTRLVVVGGGGQRDQDRRPPHDRQLGQRQRARARDHERPPRPARPACRR